MDNQGAIGDDIQAVVAFWFDEVGPAGWFASSAEAAADLDRAVARRFGGIYQGLAADAGLRRAWLRTPSGSLALMVVLDQFPRNMFRGRAQSFATDDLALAAARDAIARGHDLASPPTQRVFYYLPFEHSERLADQDEAVRLVRERADTGDFLKYAELHRDIIRRFGRFPHRNGIVGRMSTPEEVRYMQDGGHSFGAVKG